MLSVSWAFGPSSGTFLQKQILICLTRFGCSGIVAAVDAVAAKWEPCGREPEPNLWR